jgi:uncharacterized coiled-coil DUF342 family protein
MAMEALTAEREKYLEEVTNRRNKIVQLREELSEANSDIKSTNQSLESWISMHHFKTKR